MTQSKDCPDAPTNIKLTHEKDLQSGTFIIKPKTFPPHTFWRLDMAIQEKSSGHTYMCTIQLEVLPENVQNIPLKLHSDVNFLG
jgi:hypothetical protein